MIGPLKKPLSICLPWWFLLYHYCTYMTGERIRFWVTCNQSCASKKSNVVKTIHVPVLRWGQFIIISVLLLSLFNLWFFCISVTLSAFSLLSLFALSSFLWWNSVEAVREDVKGSRDQMIKAWFLKGRLSANPGLKF